MDKLRIECLDTSSPTLVDSCVTLLFNAFAKPERYSIVRLHQELDSETGLFYRQFFIALLDGKIIGIGGLKAADWAANTHLLYLSAVSRDHRNQGVGRALLEARVNWVKKNFKAGRILVSSAKSKRFREMGFKEIRGSAIDGRSLMMIRF